MPGLQQRVHGDEGYQRGLMWLVHEQEPNLLLDLARINHPSPKIHVTGVHQLHQVGGDALQDASAADDTFNDLWRLGMGWDPVEAETHFVEHSKGEGIS